MKFWTLREAQQDFDRKLLSSACIVKHEKGWIVEIQSKLSIDGIGQLGYSKASLIGTLRVFKTINAALDAVEEIGFKVKALEVK